MVKINCPGCGETMQPNDSSSKYICPNCGAEFQTGQSIGIEPAENPDMSDIGGSDGENKFPNKLCKKIIIGLIAFGVVVIVIGILVFAKKDAVVQKPMYLHSVTKDVSRAKVSFEIPAVWKETTAAEHYVLDRTFALYDCYISENEDGAVAELFVTDRIPSNSDGVHGEASCYSAGKDLRKNIFERDWREYFKSDFGGIIFDGEEDSIELPTGQKAYHCRFTLDDDI